MTRITRLSTLVFVLLSCAASAQTLQGNLFANETWSGTVNLLGDVTVPAGRTLTILAGTTVNFPSGDSMGAGESSAKTELIVQGALLVQGTSGQPVTFKSGTATQSAGAWHSIRILSGASASLQHATIQHATTALDADAGVTVSHAQIVGNTNGLRLTGGTTTVEDSVFTLTRNPLDVQGGIATVQRNVFHANCGGTASSSGYAAQFNSGAPGSVFDHNTVTQNPACYYAVYGANVSVTNNVVSENGYYGLYRTSTSMTASYNLVWGHTTNFYVTSLQGPGSQSANPLFVGGTNFRLTSRSPARMADSSGGDLGALPYISDQTALWLGTLFTDTTFQSGQTYVLDGDLTVAPGVTLTVQPGAIIRARTTDAMAAGQNTGDIELTVRGTMTVQPGSPKAHFRSDASSPAAGDWHGIVFATGSSGSVSTAILQHADVALETDVGLPLDELEVSHNTNGLRLTGGTTTVEDSVFTLTRNPLDVQGGIATVQRNVFHANCGGTASSSGYAAQFNSGAPGSVFDHNTVTQNPACYYAVYGANVSVTNNVVSENGYYGLYRTSTSMTASYNLVWGHTTNFYVTSLQGPGSQSANPLFVGGTNFRLTSRSPARMADSSGGDLGALPYISDQTALWLGTLFTDTTFQSGQTYVLDGDLTVAPGVTLTVQPGAIIRARTTDAMAAGQNTGDIELTVRGTMTVQPGSPKAHFRSDASSPAAGDWHGIVFATGSSGSVSTAILQHADVALESDVGLVLDKVEVSHNTYGLRLTGGSSTVSGSLFHLTRHPLDVQGGTAYVERNLFHSNCGGTSSSSGHAAQFNSGAPGSVFDHNTVANNPACYYAVYGGNVSVTNNIVVENGYYGLYRTASSMTAAHNLVWGHTTNFYVTALQGPGSQSTNPLFVGGGDYQLQASSPARGADDMGGDLGAFPYAPGAVASVVVTPSAHTLAAGGQVSFTAQAYDAVGQPVPNQTYVWSATSAVGTINASGVLTASCTPGTYAGAVTAQVGNITGSASVTLTTGALATMQVSPANFSLEVGASHTFTAAGKDACNNTVTVSPTWSATTAAGAITPAGEFTASCTPGSYVGAITATDGAVSASATVTLTVGTLQSLVVTPATVTLGGGAAQQFTAAGADACGTPVSAMPSWSVTSGGGSITQGGLFTATGAAGSYPDTVRAEVGSIFDTATVHITGGTLATIEVSPATGTFAPGAQTTFTAVGKDASGNIVPVSPTWSTTAGGSIHPQSGAWTAGTVAGSFPGSVVASQAGVNGTASVVIEPGPVAAVTVSPGSIEIGPGGSTTFNASARDVYGNATGTAVTWSADASAGTISTVGGFTAGEMLGTFPNAITAESEGVEGYATVTVKQGALTALIIIPSLAQVAVGGARSFTAEGRDGAGNVVPVTPTWSVLNGGGTITGGGVFVAGEQAGTFTDTIEAQANGLTARASVHVTPGPAATVTVLPAAPALDPGQVLTFAAEAHDAFGNPLGGAAFTWTALEAAGTITAEGAFTAGTQPGRYDNAVTASTGSASASVAVVIRGEGGTGGDGGTTCTCNDGEVCQDGVCVPLDQVGGGDVDGGGCGCGAGAGGLFFGLWGFGLLPLLGRRRRAGRTAGR